jgi:membrane dipeptidase
VIPIFDGHNDTITRAEVADFATGRAGGHIDIARAREGGLAGATSRSSRHPEATKRTSARPTAAAAAAAPAPALAEPSDQDVAAGRNACRWPRARRPPAHRAARDLDAALRDGVPAAGDAPRGRRGDRRRLDALDLWHRAGLRSLGPVWSRQNAFAHDVPFCVPASPGSGSGLTDAGAALVRRCAQLGIAVDLSHINEAGFWLARIDAAPLIASHSGAHAPCAGTRHLTDAQIDAIGASGGLIGIVFAVAFLPEDGRNDADTPLATSSRTRATSPTASASSTSRSARTSTARTRPAELGDAAGCHACWTRCARAGGFGKAEVRAIAWDNWRRVLERAWGG